MIDELRRRGDRNPGSEYPSLQTMADMAGRPRRIFISYRRQDTAFAAGWLFDRLNDHFRDDEIFKDIDSIDPGDDFVERINEALAGCDVFLALIGPDWLDLTAQDGRRRLDHPDDFVRIEIETALRKGIRVIPVLVGDARVPSADLLPPSIAAIARRQAVSLTSARFNLDVDQLLRATHMALAEGRSAMGTMPAPVPTIRSEGMQAAPDLPAEADQTLVRERHSSRKAALQGGLAIGIVTIGLAVGIALWGWSASARHSAANGLAPSTTGFSLTTSAPTTTSPATTMATTTTTVAAPSPATHPQAFPVVGACEEFPTTCQVSLTSEPNTSSERVGLVQESEVVIVICQTLGENLMAKNGKISDIWNRLDNGAWLTDLFVLTGTVHFVDSLPRC